MQANLASSTDETQSGGTRAAVLGINDGLVTNISLILGVAGATAELPVVKLAGMASLVAGACSMAVGEFVSMQAQVQLLQRRCSCCSACSHRLRRPSRTTTNGSPA
jgi:vacuolar iron transporter family protein